MAVDPLGRDIGNAGADFERQLLAAVTPSAKKLGGEINNLAGVVNDIVGQLGSLSAALNNFTGAVNGNVSQAKALNDEIGDARKQVVAGASAAAKATAKDIASAGGAAGGRAGGGGPTASVDTKSIEHYVRSLGHGKALLREHIIDLAKAGSINQQQLMTIQESVFWQGRYTKAHKRTRALLEDQLVLAGSQLRKLQAVSAEEASTAAHAAKLHVAKLQVNEASKRYIDHLEIANKKAAKHNTHWKNIARNVAAAGKKALKTADSIIGTITGKTISESLNFKQVIRDQFKWTQEITNTRFVQGQSAALAKKELQTMKVRLTTGQDVTTATKAYLKVFEKGMKNEKKALKVTKEGLRTATLIGSNAEATVEFSRQLTMEFQLTNAQMSAMSREMQATATATGLVGDELLAAVKASEKFMKNLRAAGTFTTEAAGQLMRMTAEAEKLNVGDTMGRIQELMTGKILEAQGEPLANLLYIAASRADETGQLTRRLMAGMAIDAKSSRKMFEGTEATYKDLVLRATGGRAENLKEVQRLIATGEMDPQQLIAIQRQVKGAFGVDVGELETTLKAWKESTLTFTERWKKLQDRENKTNIKSLSDRERLNRELQMSSTKFHEASTLLGKAKLDDADFNAFIEATQGKKAAEALRGAPEKKKRAVLTKDLYDTAIKAQQKVEKAGGVIKERLTPDVQKDLMSSDAATRDSALEKIREAMAQSNVAQKEMQNPVNRIERDVERIRQFMQFTVGGILVTVVSTVLDVLDGIWKAVTGIWNWLTGTVKKVVKVVKERGVQAAGAAGGAVLGATAGAGIGTMILPGVGTAIGGLLGGTVGALSAWLAGEKKKIPKAQGGGFVERAGIVEVHKGETIIPTANLPRSGARHAESLLRADRAGGSPDATGAQLTQDMSEVEGNTNQTVQELQMLRERLDKIITVFTEVGANPTPEHPDAGDPRARRKPRANANYYTWQMSRYTSNANKGPVSDPAF